MTKAWQSSGLVSKVMNKIADPTITKPVKPEDGKREPSDPEYAMEPYNYMMESNHLVGKLTAVLQPHPPALSPNTRAKNL